MTDNLGGVVGRGMREQMSDEQLEGLKQAVKEFNEFCDQYGETHGPEVYGEASARFDEVLMSIFLTGINPNVQAVEALITIICSEREAHQKTRAELEALRPEIAQELADCERWEAEFGGINPDVQVRIRKWRAVLERIDAARAGEGGSDE